MLETRVLKISPSAAEIIQRWFVNTRKKGRGKENGKGKEKDIQIKMGIEIRI